ncbi:MAG: YbfB/YjiJ family MFS transporter [bacterium]|nr:YbfB/YjiJ family MFS transporter [bacterium]
MKNKYIFCGFSALFIGLGIGRFAYSPLIPSVVKYNWLTLPNANDAAGFLFWGYFASLILSSMLLKNISTVKSLKVSMLLISISFLATSVIHNFIWLALWFLIIGFNTGIIFIKTPTFILSFVKEKEKGHVSGIMFTGVGIGIIFSGIISYLVVYLDLHIVWILLSIIPLLLLIITWNKWPALENALSRPEKSFPNKNKTYNKNIKLSIISYCLFRFGFLAIAVYFSEFIFQYYPSSPHIIVSLSWILFGVGIITGSFFFGYLSKHVGIKSSLITSLICGFTATILIGFRPSYLIIYLLVFIAGMGGASPTALFCGLVSTISKPEKIYHNWRNVLIGGAIALSLGTTLFNRLLNFITYYDLFFIAGMALFISIILTLFLNNKTKLELDKKIILTHKQKVNLHKPL